MPPRLPFNIGWKRASLYAAGPLFTLSLVLAASSADASFKAFLPGGEPENKVRAKITYWFAI